MFDDEGLLYIADRNNARIQVFDADGNYIRESSHPGTPCGLFMGADRHIWLAHGHCGEIVITSYSIHYTKLYEFIAAERGYIDDVIMPHSTRRRIARALRLLRNKQLANPWKKHDNIPL